MRGYTGGECNIQRYAPDTVGNYHTRTMKQMKKEKGRKKKVHFSFVWGAVCNSGNHYLIFR
jgi:hypothetical protein